MRSKTNKPVSGHKYSDSSYINGIVRDEEEIIINLTFFPACDMYKTDEYIIPPERRNIDKDIVMGDLYAYKLKYED